MRPERRCACGGEGRRLPVALTNIHLERVRAMLESKRFAMTTMSFFGFVDVACRASEQRIEAPWLYSEGDVAVALAGGPVWLDGQPLHDPAKAIADAYRSAGIRFLERLTGGFALAVTDKARARILLALDRLGIERLAYARHGDGLVFSPDAGAVSRRSSDSPKLRKQALFDYLMLHLVPAPDTVYDGVFKLRPGTCAILENGALRVERYWQPSFCCDRKGDFESLKAELHQALRSGVEACRPDESTGAFLSGGLDSSTVVGVLSRLNGQPVRTFSIGFGVDEFNEMEYARITNRFFGAAAHEYDVTADDVVRAFPSIAAAYDEPFGNSSAVPVYYCAKFAKEHGVTRLLAGDGGDELFAGNERYARQRLFEIYWRLPPVVRRRFIEPLVSFIPPEFRITVARKLRSYVDQARIPMPERLESWNYMYRIDLGAMLEPEFRQGIDTRGPFERMAEVYQSTPSPELLHRMLFFDWHYTLSDNDLRKVTTMCKLAGVDVSFPMLDPRVVDLSLKVPVPMMMKGLELRSFYKRSMQGFLPDAVIRKEKHGFGLPFGVWLKTHRDLQELIYGLLANFKTRGIVKPDFIDGVIAGHREGHPGYYGYAIWDLAMLEAWLAAHVGNGPVH